MTPCKECLRRYSSLEPGSRNHTDFKMGLMVNGQCNRCTNVSTDAVEYQQLVVQALSEKYGYTHAAAGTLVSRHAKVLVEGILRMESPFTTAWAINTSEGMDLELQQDIRDSLKDWRAE